MNRKIFLLALLVSVAALFPAAAASGKIKKVLPHFLDQKGRHALSPSLYERDAYQVFLRDNPESRGGLRFDVNYDTKGATYAPLRIRAELRGTAVGKLPRTIVLEKEVPSARGLFPKWRGLELVGEAYREFGDVTAWRVTLWEGDTLLDEQKSFLW